MVTGSKNGYFCGLGCAICLMAFLGIFRPALVHAQDKTAYTVGNISPDPSIDDPEFRFCSDTYVFQGYELRTKDNDKRKEINDYLLQEFRPDPSWHAETGFIVVRFGVNCLGLTGRHRISGIGPDLKPKHFSERLSQYLLKLVKQTRWPEGSYKFMTVDYYQSVIFKIENGKLIAAL